MFFFNKKVQLDLTKKIPKKFSSKSLFPHTPPFHDVFSERIPLLIAFQFAISNFVKSNKQYSTTLDFLSKSLGRPLFVAAECGVYMGSSLVACSNLARDFNIKYQIHGFDTFSGLPKPSPKDLEFAPEDAKYINNTLFDDTSINLVKERLKNFNLKHIFLHKGLFSETLIKQPERKYDFVNIDCDIYDPHIECLEYFYPRMKKGGIIFFDDYHSVEFPMAKQAIDHFLHDKEEKLFHLRYGENHNNHTKAYIVKY